MTTYIGVRRNLGWIEYTVFALSFLLLGALICLSYILQLEQSANHVLTTRYLALERAARAMRDASEFLTRQARLYARTLNREHALNYLKEVYQNHTRENSMSVLYEYRDDHDSSTNSLRNAMRFSEALAKKELYALKLLATAAGDSMDGMDELKRGVVLTSIDQQASKEEALQKGRDLLFNTAYDLEQQQIMNALHTFMDTGRTLANAEEQAHSRAAELYLILIPIALGALFSCLVYLFARILQLRRRR